MGFITKTPALRRSFPTEGRPAGSPIVASAIDRPRAHLGSPHEVAFVLGGGGVLGAHEVGMLKALASCSITPDIILGTSIGAVNGAMFAADPTVAGVDRLGRLWTEANLSGVSAGDLWRRVSTLARTGTHLQPLDDLRLRLVDALPVARVQDLAVPFQCVAASIERAAEHWFTEGDLVDVVLASCAVPGVLPPVPIGDEHFIDGGIVNSIPVDRAVGLGAKTIYVLQVGRLEQPLKPPRWPWEVGLVAFEVARRHRFASDLVSLPPEVTLHVLPTGGSAAPAYNDVAGQLRVRRIARGVAEQIDTSYRASLQYLQGL
jgi:NTE family protein